MLVANVYVNLPLKSIASAFSYRVPEQFSFLQVGWRVFVPFGGRSVEGFVLEVKEQPSSDIALKDILSLVDDEPWFNERTLALADWMHDFYLCSRAETMRLFMPGKSGLRIEAAYRALTDVKESAMLAADTYRAVYSYIKEHAPVRANELSGKFPLYREQLPNLLEKLVHYKLIQKEYLAKRRENIKLERIVLRAVSLESAEAMSPRKLTPKQRQLLESLEARSPQSVAELKAQDISSSVIRTAEKSGLVTIEERRKLRDSYRDLEAYQQAVELSESQKIAMEAIRPCIEAGRQQAFLLQGVTGSGKTQVYIEAARLVRAKGKQVIVLVPEIALTSQIVIAFKSVFAEDMIVMHSQISLAERNDAIARLRQREVGIVIGARSALFVPTDEVGLIILDEEQDLSYKQDEAPRYHARVVAEAMAKMHRAVLLLGSATPSLETAYRAACGEIVKLSMPDRIGNRPLPIVQSVDMREELKSGHRRILSRALESLIEATLAKGEQLILMLNRRGFSTFVLCRSCGEALKCECCELPLVYHKDGSLLCHHCDIKVPVPMTCPKCGSPYIRYFGSGTEKLEHELQEKFPQARVVRMDRDTTGRKFAHQEILTAFREKKYDVLLGTQMVAKGHDIPNVTAVGILSADASLNLPDYRAAERTFMLITQTAGRAGRGEQEGRVVVQCYNPEHYAVQTGAAQDYEGFYREEIKLRKALSYPPFVRLVKLTFHRAGEEAVKAWAMEVKARFRAAFHSEQGVEIIGPAPAMIARLRGIDRCCLLIKAVKLAPVQAFLKEIHLHTENDVTIDIDPISIV
ncbi:primosomal protein N' [Selenomonas sp. TAMA-11512]|uniref:replication restart helicase PriA n=1 Tax=Selenomonas sp. TAMA-11512 TaxID=3095337 RepID=UPI003087EA37|nr:primosomal protein N' [Selenomonas sp. TAMA-11512]